LEVKVAIRDPRFYFFLIDSIGAFAALSKKDGMWRYRTELSGNPQAVDLQCLLSPDKVTRELEIFIPVKILVTHKKK
tara:strand:+ start:48 stop:278 length:231 start_codon:yes stop_codon:yes gene_type:complete